MAETRSRVNLANLRKIRQNLPKMLKDALVDTANIIAEDAANRAVKDTTFLAESIYVVHTGFSGYEIARTLAEEHFNTAKTAGRTPKGKRLGPNSKYGFFPEIKPTSENEVWIVVGALHGLRNERGLENHAFLAPAMYAHKTTLTASVRKVFGGAGAKAVITNPKFNAKG